MDLHLRGLRALITGGSRGIGLAAAETLAEVVCDVTRVARDAAALEAAADRIRSRWGVRAETIPADLSTEAAVRDVAARAGTPDILVNNAGAIPPGNLLAVDDNTWLAAWALKVHGFIRLTRALYPGMAARRSGVVVNVIGAAGERLPPDYVTGATGNAALMASTRALGRAAPRDGLGVVGSNPGPVAP